MQDSHIYIFPLVKQKIKKNLFWIYDREINYPYLSKAKMQYVMFILKILLGIFITAWFFSLLYEMSIGISFHNLFGIIIAKTKYVRSLKIN